LVCPHTSLYIVNHAIYQLSWSSKLIELSRNGIWISILREKAYHNSIIYKERTKMWHDKRLNHKEFKPGDKVLLFNSRLKLFGHGKLKSKWKGLFNVIDTSSHGAITLQDDSDIYLR
jgi:hypothetical protein